MLATKSAEIFEHGRVKYESGSISVKHHIFNEKRPFLMRQIAHRNKRLAE